MADPTRLDELVMSSGAAAQYGLHIGSTLPVAFFSSAQVGSPAFRGYPKDAPPPHRHLQPGPHRGWSPQVVEDDDAALGNQIAIVTPALTRSLKVAVPSTPTSRCTSPVVLMHESAVVSDVTKLLPQLGPVGGSSTNRSPFSPRPRRAIRPEAIALGVFGLIAGLAALVINAQVIGRLSGGTPTKAPSSAR